MTLNVLLIWYSIKTVPYLLCISGGQDPEQAGAAGVRFPSSSVCPHPVWGNVLQRPGAELQHPVHLPPCRGGPKSCRAEPAAPLLLEESGGCQGVPGPPHPETGQVHPELRSDLQGTGEEGTQTPHSKMNYYVSLFPFIIISFPSYLPPPPANIVFIANMVFFSFFSFFYKLISNICPLTLIITYYNNNFLSFRRWETVVSNWRAFLQYWLFPFLLSTQDLVNGFYTKCLQCLLRDSRLVSRTWPTGSGVSLTDNWYNWWWILLIRLRICCFSLVYIILNETYFGFKLLVELK